MNCIFYYCALFVVAFIATASAQAVVPVSTNIDWSPLITPVLAALGLLIASVIGLIGTMIVNKLKAGKLLSSQQAAQIQANITTIGMAAGQAGVMAAQKEITDHGWDHTVTQNKIVAEAASYALQKFPDQLKQAGFDPTTTEGQKNVSDLINSMLPAIVSQAAASPTTPPADKTPVQTMWSSGAGPTTKVAP
jgi:hypothetical protein